MPAPAASGRDDLEGADIPLLTDGLNGGPKRLSDITRSFGWMGWAAFGGPAAHVGLFQKVLFCGGMRVPAAKPLCLGSWHAPQRRTAKALWQILFKVFQLAISDGTDADPS